jgi:hypothetical protein
LKNFNNLDPNDDKGLVHDIKNIYRDNDFCCVEEGTKCELFFGTKTSENSTANAGKKVFTFTTKLDQLNYDCNQTKTPGCKYDEQRTNYNAIVSDGKHLVVNLTDMDEMF